ncbi:MAG: transketolase family protein [Bacteroidales bacterium]|nr:transketolase family protein [Bacteroidales bacterium]
MKKYIDTGKKDTRSGFGAGLLEAGRADSRIVALAADLTASVKIDAFAREFPERFIQCGIAEANMISAAAGLSVAGKIPFCGSFAEFISGRVYDQVRMDVAYARANVKLASSHSGITLGEDGATHQTMEDIALMRALPGMAVLVPCDCNQTRQATLAAAKYEGPVYLRFGRPAMPNFTDPDQSFEIGKIYVMNPGTDVSLLACGHLVWEALQAAEILENEGISAEVLNVSSIKPLDVDCLLDSASRTGAFVIAEEHNMAGGLGEAVCGALAARRPIPVEFINGGDRFGQSGSPAELLKVYGMDAVHIAEAARKVIGRK